MHKRKISVTATLSISQLYKEAKEAHKSHGEGKGIVSSHERIQRTVCSHDNAELRSSHLESDRFLYEKITEILSTEVRWRLSEQIFQAQTCVRSKISVVTPTIVQKAALSVAILTNL
jgi:uncharacterized hydantoinase/oxoprolinase family protein